MKKIACLMIFYSLPDLSCASISTDLASFVNGIGYASNVTAPHAYQSQAAGFFGGGNLYARNQVRQYQLISLDLPSYRAGCGGIDLFTGSLSFLSHEKLVDLGKQIMTNGGAYAVDVMLATTVPELKIVRDNLMSLQQAANRASIRSCETAQAFVGGIFPKTAESQQKICRDQAANDGVASDYVKARMDCAGSKFDSEMEKASKDPVRKKQVVLNKNLVWEIIREKSFLADDMELAEMVMSLTGTVIIDKAGKVTQVPSLATSADLINALAGGAGVSKAKIWQCQDRTPNTSCLSVKLEAVNIPETSTLTWKVKEIIHLLNTRLKEDVKPDTREINFLSMTSFPVLKFLTVLNSTQYGNAAVDIEEYAGLIAQDLLQNYLGELLQEVTNATMGSAFNEDLVAMIEKRTREARREIARIDPRVGRKLQEKLSLIERIATIEKQVASDFADAG